MMRYLTLRSRLVAATTCLTAIVALTVAGCSGGAARESISVPTGNGTSTGGSSTVYYVALGDSLSQGVQPDSNGATSDTDQGYADDLFAHYSSAFHGPLTLVKLGCPSETTSSMLTGSGSPCSYPQGSQLAAAVAFIKAHQSQIGLITIDIGANDVVGCVSATSIDPSCEAGGLLEASRDLPQILSALRSAAGSGTEIAGMTLYDPFLAAYFGGAAGQSLATQSINLLAQLNQLLTSGYQANGIQIADVAGAFATTDENGAIQVSGQGTAPVDVANICQWTWMCAASPVGPNIHANTDGYQVIADAFEKAIGTPSGSNS